MYNRGIENDVLENFVLCHEWMCQLAASIFALSGSETMYTLFDKHTAIHKSMFNFVQALSMGYPYLMTE